MSVPTSVKHRLFITKDTNNTRSAAAAAAAPAEEKTKPKATTTTTTATATTTTAPATTATTTNKKENKKENKKPVEENQQVEKEKKKDKKDKKTRQEEKAKEEENVDRDAPIVDNIENAQFGDLRTIQSQSRTNRHWTLINQLDESKAGTKVWVRARVDNVRGKGKACFLVLRRGYSNVQGVMFAGDTIPKEMIKYASKLPTETLVEIYAQVNTVKEPTATSQSNVELQIEKIFAISIAAPLPFQLEDASRPELPEGQEEEEDDKKEIRVGQVIRLDNRWVDLRIPSNQAIFKIQAGVCRYFRNFMDSRGFIEIHTPKITPGVSEGGASVFRLEYFGQPACLAQSPQLYKQMAAAGSDFGRVYEIGPVFRAENSHTHRHLCEFMGLDIEMEIVEHYLEVVELLGEFFVYLFDNLNEHCAAELKAINKQYPFEPLKYLRKTLVINFKEAIQLLRENGEDIGDFDDFSTPQEKKLGGIVKEKYGTDFYVVDKYPLKVRPFYTMPCPNDPNYTNSYDFFIRGEEIISGAQRIHEVPLLKKRAAECGIPENNISAYVESFKYGCPPHGGCGIGLERVTMLFLGLNNIRKSSLFPRDPVRLTP